MFPVNNTRKITIRAEINKWVSKNFPLHRTHITHFSPEQINHDLWSVSLSVKDKPSIILGDLKIDGRLLLTDPPYGISSPYTCEKQVPRRLRKDGSDFIMPKGSFGEWDFPMKKILQCIHRHIREYKQN